VPEYRPKFKAMVGGTFGVPPVGFQPIIILHSNGKDTAVDINLEIVPYLTAHIIDVLLAQLKDGLYRARPDLKGN